MGHIGQERAMEEILSSIKRVIAEGGEAGRQRRASAADTELPPADETAAGEPEVLELTDSIGAEHPALDDDLARFETDGEDDASDDVPDLWRDDTPVTEPEPEPEPEPEEASMIEQAGPAARSDAVAEPGGARGEIASHETVAATRESLAALSRLIVRDEGGDVTLEALVRELLRPMLADWLDANLPALVERMVKAEIARIAR